MRIVCEDHTICFAQRPFAGTLGASLYLGDGDPSADPGQTSIVYRRNLILDGVDQLVSCGVTLPLGASSVPKTPAVAQVASPTDELSYAIPAALHGRVVWAQVRTFAGDVENESIYRPRRIVLDGDGDLDDRILGAARVTELVALDGGGVLVRFTYDAARDGAQPTQFALVRTAGPTSPASGTTPFVSGGRRYEISIPSLQHAGSYTFKLRADAASSAADLVTGILFTADGAGPPAVSSLSVEEY